MSPYAVLFECLAYGLFFACVWDARKQGKFFVVELLWTGLYGFLLEWLTIKQLHAYHYGAFLLMIDGAPVAVALGWAVIIYTAMRFSSSTLLPQAVRPLLDALLALNIDLALDAIAIRLGMWFWTGVAFDQQWFGVPWANFWAWFVVVWSFSALVRAFRSWQLHAIRRWLYVPAAMLLSLLIVIVSSELYRSMSSVSSHAAASLFLLAGSVAIVLRARLHVMEDGSSQRIILIVPLLFHSFALIAGFSTGIFAQQPALAVIGIVMLVVSLLVHFGVTVW